MTESFIVLSQVATQSKEPTACPQTLGWWCRWCLLGWRFALDIIMLRSLEHLGQLTVPYARSTRSDGTAPIT